MHEHSGWVIELGNIRLDENPAAMNEKSQITPVDDIAYNTQKLEENAKKLVGNLGFYHY